MIDIGARLQQLMDERGLNMYSLTKRSGLSWNTIKDFYARQSKPTVTTLSMLCDGLGITLSQFFEEDDNSVPPECRTATHHQPLEPADR